MVSGTVKRVIHLYNIEAGGCKIVFVIAIDPVNGSDGLYSFTLFSKSGNVERRVGSPAQLKVAFQPEDAEFDVSLTPRENASPPNSHYSLRVWIRRSDAENRQISPSNGPLNPVYRHRLFSEEEFHVAMFPMDVYAPTPPRKNGSGGHRHSGTPPQPTVLATPDNITDRRHVLTALVSGVMMTYIISIRDASSRASSEYLVSLEAEAGGITRSLCRDTPLRITCDLSSLGFTLYTTFLRQTSTGTIHHLAFWICSPQPSSSSPESPNEEHDIEGVCQRLWQTDTFLVTSPVLSLSSSSRSGAGPTMIVAKKDPRGSFSIDLPASNPFTSSAQSTSDTQSQSDRLSRSDSIIATRGQPRGPYPPEKDASRFAAATAAATSSPAISRPLPSTSPPMMSSNNGGSEPFQSPSRSQIHPQPHSHSHSHPLPQPPVVDPRQALWEPPSYSYAYSTMEQPTSADREAGTFITTSDAAESVARTFQTGWYQSDEGHNS